MRTRIRPAVETLLAPVRPYVLLGCLAWTVGTRGGTSPRDLALVTTVLVVAVATTSFPVRWPPEALGLSLCTLLLWTIIDGPLRVGISLTSMRPAALLMIALAVVRFFSSLPA